MADSGIFFSEIVFPSTSPTNRFPEMVTALHASNDSPDILECKGWNRVLRIKVFSEKLNPSTDLAYKTR
jgi:hypothetical protein